MSVMVEPKTRRFMVEPKPEDRILPALTLACGRPRLGCWCWYLKTLFLQINRNPFQVKGIHRGRHWGQELLHPMPTKPSLLGLWNSPVMSVGEGTRAYSTVTSLCANPDQSDPNK